MANGIFTLRAFLTAMSKEYPRDPVETGLLTSHSAPQAPLEDLAGDQLVVYRQPNFFDKRTLDLVKRLGLRQLHLTCAERLDQLDAIKRRDVDCHVPSSSTIDEFDVDGTSAIHEVEGRHMGGGVREWPSNHDSTNEILRVTAKARGLGH